MSILYMFVPYALAALAEVLINVSYYELCYTQVPASMRSLAQGLNLLQSSIGSALNTILTGIFSFWIKSNNLNNDNMSYMFILFSLVILIGTIIFLYCVKEFSYLNVGNDNDVAMAKLSMNSRLSSSFDYTSGKYIRRSINSQISDTNK